MSTVRWAAVPAAAGACIRLLLALLVPALALAACDASPLPPAHSPDTFALATVPVPVRSISTPPAELSTPLAERELLTFTLVVPAGGRGCATSPEAQVVGYDDETIRVQTSVASNQARWCTSSRTLRVTSRIGQRGRALVVNGLSWKPDAGVGYLRCSVEVGCDPPENRCDPVWTATLTPHFDLPPEKHAKVVACAGRWLVLDVDSAPMGCRAGSPRSCAGHGVRRRWFAELDATRNWHVVASGTAAGCSDVRRSVPRFPVRLCASLPAR